MILLKVSLLSLFGGGGRKASRVADHTATAHLIVRVCSGVVGMLVLLFCRLSPQQFAAANAEITTPETFCLRYYLCL